jgi:transposase
MHFYFEAGPTGYGLYHQLITMGHGCTVVAAFADPPQSG